MKNSVGERAQDATLEEVGYSKALAMEGRRPWDLDFRTKLFMTIVISTVCILGSIQRHYPIIAFIASVTPFVFLFTIKKLSAALKGIAAIAIASLLASFVVDKSPTMISVVALIISGFVLKMTPGAMMVYYLMSTTTMSDMVESMRRMRVPDTLIIPISVMFRFFYSIHEDYSQINDAMRMHGLTMINAFKEPVRIMEYKIVPLLMCSTKAADDVTVSAMTRGMSVGEERTSISTAKLRVFDYLMLLYMIFLVCCLVITII